MDIIAYSSSKGINIDSLKSTGKIMLRNRDPVTFVISGIADEIERHYQTKNIIAGCAAGIANAYIDSIGNIYPCASIPIVAGNILTSDFSEIWKNADILNTLRNRELLKGKCGDCDYKYICGGCRASAYLKTGDILETDHFCMLE